MIKAYKINSNKDNEKVSYVIENILDCGIHTIYIPYNDIDYNHLISIGYNVSIWHQLLFRPRLLINSEQALDKKLLEIKTWKKKPSLLLHACCGPCSSYVIEYLSNYFNITIHFCNPNIDTLEEYNLRLNEVYEVVNKINNEVAVIVDEYKPEDYYQAIKGLEHLGEHSKRCYECYKLRIEASAKICKVKHFDYFSTTLSISPYKDANWINSIGQELAKKYNVKFLYSDFKAKGGYIRSIELSKKFSLYRQNYCGCIYSKEHNILE